MPPRRACDLCYKRKIQCLITTPGKPCDWCSGQGLTCTFERVVRKDPNKRTTSDLVHSLSQRVKELEGALHAAQSTETSTTSSVGISPRWPQPTRQYPLPDAASSPAGHRQSPAASSNSPSVHVTSSAAIRPTNRAEPAYKLSRCQLGTNWYFKGIGVISQRGQQWVYEGAGQRLPLDNLDGHAPDQPGSLVPRLDVASPDPTSPGLSRSAVPRLPSEAACRYQLSVLLRSKTSIVFPILERDLFEATIVAAYNDVQGRTSSGNAGIQRSAQACIWAMIALVASAADVQHLDPSFDTTECVNEARRLLLANSSAPNLDALQASLLIWAHQKMNGQCREATITFTTACRMVCDLGGHFSLAHLPILPQHIPIFDEPTRLHIRKLFWLCYCFDKDVCLRTNSPPLLTSEHCDITDGFEVSVFTAQSIYHKSPRPWFPRSTTLAQIKETAANLLTSPRAFRYTEGELLAHVRQLDEQVEEWRLAINPRHRPRLSIPPSSTTTTTTTSSSSTSSHEITINVIPHATTMSDEERTYTINLQLDYLFTMLNIHTLVRKCGDLTANLPDDLHSAVHSSADLSIEASRSIFRLLPTVIDFWQQNSVWVVSHHAAMASMPLFINILIHPLGEPADSDLLILSSIGNITRSIPTQRLGKGAIDHVQEIGEFVMQLVKLGQMAAWKVKRGERQVDLDMLQ